MVPRRARPPLTITLGSSREMATQIIAQPIGVAMLTVKYSSREAYVVAIRELQLRAQRSGWRLGDVHRNQLAAWLNVTTDTLVAHNRDYGISIDDIRTGRL
jgi:hypothetical protein